MNVSIMQKTMIIFILLFTGVITGIVHADGKKLDMNGFSITLPDGWVEIPGNVLDEYGRRVAKLVPGKDFIKYECGLQLNTAKEFFDYPHVLVQFENTSPISESQLNLLEKFSGTSNLETDVMVYEKNHNMLWMRIETYAADKGSIRGLIGMIPTKKGIIQVMGASLRDTYADYDPVFQAIARSVQPEPGLACLAPLPQPLEEMTGDKTGMIQWKVLPAAVLLSLFGIMAALMVYRNKKKKSGGH